MNAYVKDLPHDEFYTIAGRDLMEQFRQSDKWKRMSVLAAKVMLNEWARRKRKAKDAEGCKDCA